MAEYDLILRNGTVIDGTGAPRFVADIAILDGKFVAIEPGIAGKGAEEFDATGLIVAPGNIDPHTHYDAQVHWDPYCTNTGWHGGSTVVVGNCGFGFMPCKVEDRERYMLMMHNTEQVPLEAMRMALSWNWQTYPEWIDVMRRLPKGINIASYLPLNSLMIYVMGYEAAKSRGATREERLTMRNLLNEAMDAGAIGFGFSYLNGFNSHKDIDGSPMPTDAMNVEDIYYLAEVLKERGEGVIQALVQIPSVDNSHVAEELARRSGRPILHNIILAFDDMPQYHEDILAWLDKVSDEGLEIYSQALAMRTWSEFNPHDYASWNNVDPFHEFAHAGGPAEKSKLAANPDFRARALEQYHPEDMVAAGGAIEALTLQRATGAPEWERFEGKTFAQIAEEKGGTALDSFFDIVAATECRADFRTAGTTSWDPVKIARIMKHPRVLPGTSDGGAHIKEYAGGHFPTDMITWLVRETGSFTLEEMHHKLSGLPARALRLHKRGNVKIGQAADLYVYDFDAIDYDRNAYEVLYDLPGGDWRRTVKAKGIRLAVVNGEVIARDGEMTGKHPGRLLANRGAAADERITNIVGSANKSELAAAE